jgi:hypothetical protein
MSKRDPKIGPSSSGPLEEKPVITQDVQAQKPVIYL